MYSRLFDSTSIGSSLLVGDRPAINSPLLKATVSGCLFNADNHASVHPYVGNWSTQDRREDHDVTGCTSTGYTEYHTAMSSLPNSPRTHVSGEDTQILQAIDRSCGIVFERVCQGQGRGDEGAVEVHEQDALEAFLFGHSSDLSYHLVPKDWLSPTQAAEASCSDAKQEPSKPSLMLTVPTPVVPQSPVFVPQSPITVSKFFAAPAPSPPVKSLFDDQSPSRTSLAVISVSQTSVGLFKPSLTSCGHCGLWEFEHGLQCRLCNERWLACKVWYRANDGGRRQWLTEPYIKPGECNERNRAMMRDLGLGIGVSTSREMNSALFDNGWQTMMAWMQAFRARGAPRSMLLNTQALRMPLTNGLELWNKAQASPLIAQPKMASKILLHKSKSRASKIIPPVQRGLKSVSEKFDRASTIVRSSAQRASRGLRRSLIIDGSHFNMQNRMKLLPLPTST